MNILIFGGTGFIGSNLIPSLIKENHTIYAVARSPEKAGKILGSAVKTISAEEFKDKSATKKLPLIDAVINLAGETIAQRWTPSAKKRILESRVNTAGTIAEAIRRNIITPELFINMSAVGYYGFGQDEEFTEESKSGTGFLADVCKAWETEAMKAADSTRVVILRSGIVLGKNGGALKRMILPFKFFLGGTLGSGKQWMPWIHIEDLTGIISVVLGNKNVDGPINSVSPNTIRMKELTDNIGRVMHRPSLFSVPGFALKAALGETSSMLLNGQKVLPQKLNSLGFKFTYAELRQALENCLKP